MNAEALRGFYLNHGYLDFKLLNSEIGFAVENNASGIVLAHNHPSGNLNASNEDKILTKKIQDAGRVLEINVLDHIIIAENNYTSFADSGLM